MAKSVESPQSQNCLTWCLLHGQGHVILPQKPSPTGGEFTVKNYKPQEQMNHYKKENQQRQYIGKFK